MIIKGKKTNGIIFDKNRIMSDFKIDGTNDWSRYYDDKDFLQKLGLKSPYETILVARSGSTIPTEDGKIAGVCLLRHDKKDEDVGGYYNWNHYDLIMKNNNEIVLITSEQKRSDHWFDEVDEWIERIIKNPPHLDQLDYEI